MFSRAIENIRDVEEVTKVESLEEVVNNLKGHQWME